MNDYKALKIDYERVIGADGENYNLYCLSDRHIAVLLSQTGYIGWLTRWEYDTPPAQDFIDRIQAEIEGSLINPMSCSDISQQRTNITINNYLRAQRYTGTNTSIDPDAPTTNLNWTGAASENEAFCTASEDYCRMTFINVQNALAVAAGAIGFTAGLLGWAYPALGAIVGGAVVLGSGIVIGAVNQALEDGEAVTSYICKFYNALRNKAATQASFTSSINTIVPAVGNEQTLHEIIKLCSTRVESWYWYVELLGNAKRLGLSGVSSCDCGINWTWSYSASSCVYNLPSGWTLTIQSGVCGNGAGSFDGIYDYVYPVYRGALIQTVIGTSGSKVKTVTITALRQAGTTSVNYVRVTCGSYLYSYPIDPAGIVTTLTFSGIDQNADIVIRGEILGLGQQNGLVITGISVDYE